MRRATDYDRKTNSDLIDLRQALLHEPAALGAVILVGGTNANVFGSILE